MNADHDKQSELQKMLALKKHVHHRPASPMDFLKR